MRVGILGGGLAGLSAARFLRQAVPQAQCEVLEAEARVGGLCRSAQKEGFIYDLGGHILFSRDQALLQALLDVLGDRARQRRRNNKVLVKGRILKYPFENDLAALDKEDLFECLYHYLVDRYPPPTNFAEWMYATFGKGIAELYLLPYNRKIWKMDPAHMSTVWVERVPRPPMEDVIRSAIGIPTEGYVHQLYFYYPQDGGIETLVRCSAQAAQAGERPCRIVTGFRVSHIESTPDGWLVASDRGVQQRFDRLVSTIPIQELAAALVDCPSEVRETAGKLRYNSVIVVLLGVRRSVLPDYTALYIPDPDVICHRVCFNNSFSEVNSPEGCASLMAEITAPPDSELAGQPDSFFIGRVADFAVSQGWCERGDIVVTDVTRAQYAYVVADLDYVANRERVAQYFEARGIALCGRFGTFQYWNMDQVLADAMEVARRVAGG